MYLCKTHQNTTFNTINIQFYYFTHTHKNMIRGITFSLLDESTLHKKTSAYDKRLLSQKHITHLGNIAVLPYDCYPNIKRPDGEYKDNLHRLYSQLYNSLHKEHDDTQLRQNTEAIIEEIKNRWKSGKMGRWRQDLCGKRCNFTARSVLTPNPHLSLVQVGIPSIWKKTLTLQETWSPDMRVVAVIDKNNRKFDPRYRKPSEGCIVLRQLEEGELVLVNRQPTLRVSNFVAMEILWTQGKTVQMHPGLFSMFDADCDGDEINIHVPQIPQQELQSMRIKHAIFNYGNNSLGSIRHSRCGCWVVSRTYIEFKK